MSDTHNRIDGNLSEEVYLASSLPARSGPYRSLSAKRPRDPSHRKSVSFNDVPIVHEVPLYDSVRNSSYDIYRPWVYADTAPPMSIISPFSSSSLHLSSTANYRVSSARPSHILTNRITDWTARGKALKSTDEIIDHSAAYNPPLIVVHTPDERTQLHSSLSRPLMSETGEEKKHPYRPATPHHPEHVRSLPFSYVPLSESTVTYTSMLSANLAFHEQYSTGNTRTARVRSATLPTTVVHPSTRQTDNSSATPSRPTTSSSRTVLKPATIDFQCAQPTTALLTSKSPSVPARLSSAAAHPRLLTSFNRPSSSAIKYNFTHPISETGSKSPHGISLSRSRSANILSNRRHATSPVAVFDGQSEATNLYLSTKRTPNMRHAYGSYYTQRVLLPTDTN